MYTGIKHLHSFIPYILLTLLILSVIVFAIKSSRKASFAKSDKLLALLTLIFTHIQFLAGLILYFVSPITKSAWENSSEIMKDPYRFYAIEHAFAMILAVFFITLGYRKHKKAEGSGKFRPLFIFYLLGLICGLSRIPWEAWL